MFEDVSPGRGFIYVLYIDFYSLIVAERVEYLFSYYMIMILLRTYLLSVKF